MKSKEIAYISPSVTKWAINRSDKSFPQIEESLKLKESELADWIKGNAHPSFAKAVKLAKLLRIPFGFLFLEQPPEIEIPLPDFRTHKYPEFSKPSLELMDTLYSALARRDWYREYLLERGVEPLDFVGSATTSNDIKAVAKEISKALNIEDIRTRSNSWQSFRVNLVEHIESIGVLVMQSSVVGNNTTRKLSVKEFQGFAITDDFAPVIFINSADFDSAKTFTLIHELTHIWIGKSGISNTNEILPNSAIPFVEEFCNKVTVEALVPEKEFLKLCNDWIDIKEITKLAKYFWVSSLVILRRAKELSLIRGSDFNKLYKEVQELLKTKRSPSGGNFWNNLESRTGTNFFDAITKDVRRGGTNYREGAKLLGVKVSALERHLLGKNLGGKN